MSAETKQMSALDIFKKSQETLDDARKKSLEESGNKTKYFRLSQDGTFNVRILPLAPVIDKDGNPIFPMDRVGYEYPVKEQVLKIKSTDGKKTNYVSVCNAKYAFPKLEKDLIDLYVELCCDLYADDEALCKKVRETSFNGGLRYDSKRCMYIFDLDKRGDGLQILQLSFSQYRELEERKLKLWEKLNKNGNVPCPISSVDAAFPLEITRATEKKKTNYSFNIDTVSPKDVLTEEETQMLLDAPRLPEVLYRYTRYHLEATIAFLEQWDETAGLNVMKEKEIQDCIDQIKLLIPASDQSHFMTSGICTKRLIRLDLMTSRKRARISVQLSRSSSRTTSLKPESLAVSQTLTSLVTSRMSLRLLRKRTRMLQRMTSQRTNPKMTLLLLNRRMNQRMSQKSRLQGADQLVTRTPTSQPLVLKGA